MPGLMLHGTVFLVSIPTYKLDLLLALRKDYVVYLLSNTNENPLEMVLRTCFSL